MNLQKEFAIHVMICYSILHCLRIFTAIFWNGTAQTKRHHVLLPDYNLNKLNQLLRQQDVSIHRIFNVEFVYISYISVFLLFSLRIVQTFAHRSLWHVLPSIYCVAIQPFAYMGLILLLS